MAVEGAWFITPHAVRRYIELVDRSLSYEEARAALIRASLAAHRVKELEPGIALWRTGLPLRLRLRVAERGPGLPQLLTVMRGHDAGWGPPKCV